MILIGNDIYNSQDKSSSTTEGEDSSEHKSEDACSYIEIFS